MHSNKCIVCVLVDPQVVVVCQIHIAHRGLACGVLYTLLVYLRWFDVSISNWSLFLFLVFTFTIKKNVSSHRSEVVNGTNNLIFFLSALVVLIFFSSRRRYQIKFHFKHVIRFVFVFVVTSDNCYDISKEGFPILVRSLSVS